jgi:hypothetical protein
MTHAKSKNQSNGVKGTKTVRMCSHHGWEWPGTCSTPTVQRRQCSAVSERRALDGVGGDALCESRRRTRTVQHIQCSAISEQRALNEADAVGGRALCESRRRTTRYESSCMRVWKRANDSRDVVIEYEPTQMST